MRPAQKQLLIIERIAARVNNFTIPCGFAGLGAPEASRGSLIKPLKLACIAYKQARAL